MKKISILILTFVMFNLLFSCREQVKIQDEHKPVVTVKTALVKQGLIESTVNLNGKTIYLKKNKIVSPIAGYIVKMNIKFGDKVKKNDVLFVIQTKENKALKNINTFTDNIGTIKVLASSGGFINKLNINETGGYIVEGSLLCTIVDNTDLMVLINVPYEYNSLLKIGTKCKISLADNTTVKGAISRILPTINASDQTQIVLIRLNTIRHLPENLNIIAQFIKAQHSHSYLVPKKAVMTNETEKKFWVMKIFNNNVAVKIPILKGIENDSTVEILSSNLNKNDLVISEGAYGLPDSTVVKIVK